METLEENIARVLKEEVAPATAFREKGRLK